MTQEQLAFDRFSNSGRFINAVSYVEKNPQAKVSNLCTDVIMYHDGHFIQLLKSGMFMVNESFVSRSLDEAETFLFTTVINKKMNDS